MDRSRIVALILAFTLVSGCSLTPQQKKWTGIGLAVLAVGAIAAHREDSGAPVTPDVKTPNVDCASNPQLCR